MPVLRAQVAVGRPGASTVTVSCTAAAVVGRSVPIGREGAHFSESAFPTTGPRGKSRAIAPRDPAGLVQLRIEPFGCY